MGEERWSLRSVGGPEREVSIERLSLTGNLEVVTNQGLG